MIRSTDCRQILSRACQLALCLSLALTGCSGTATPCPAQPTAAETVAAPSSASSSEVAQAVAPATPPPLALWADTARRQAILDFVARVTDPKLPSYVPVAERIAVFDNDGTLWSEKPMYVQLAFVLDRIRALSPQHPEWKKKQPYKAVLDGDVKALLAMGNEALIPLMMRTHAATTAEQFDTLVKDWLTTARHPKYNQPYTELTYAPMLELLDYLRAHDFKTFIVSGGGVSFMRPWVEAAYGIPPEQVIGSRIKAVWKDGEGGGQIDRLDEIEFINDGPGKVVGIYNAIGRRPIFAAGNSDGDLAMLKWTAEGPGPRLALLVHHTDEAREDAYDRLSGIGKLDQALDLAEQASARGRPWTVVDMKTDWKKVFRSDLPVPTAPAPPENQLQPAATTQTAAAEPTTTVAQ